MRATAKYEIQAKDKTAKGIKSAKNNLNLLNSAFTGLANKATGMLASVGVAMAGAFAVKSIKKFMVEQLKADDLIAKMSTKLGASTEALSQYRFAAALSGVEFSTFTTSLEKMTVAVAKGGRGLKEEERAFKALELRIEDLLLLAPEIQLEKIADALLAVKTAGERGDITRVIFGRAGSELTTMFQTGSKGLREMRKRADELGFTLEDSVARQAERTNDAILEMTESMLNAFRRMARGAAPSLEFIALFFADVMPSVLTALTPIVNQFALGMVLTLGDLAVFLGNFAKGLQMDDTADSFYKAASGVSEFVRKLHFPEESNSAQKSIGALTDRVREYLDLDPSSAPGPLAMEGFRREADRIVKSMQTPLEKNNAQIENIKKLEKLGVLAFSNYVKKYKLLNEEYEKIRNPELGSMLEEIEKMREGTRTAGEIKDAAISHLLELQAALTKLGSEALTPDLFSRQMTAIHQAFAESDPGAQRIKAAAEEVKATLMSTGDVLKAQIELAREAFQAGEIGMWDFIEFQATLMKLMGDAAQGPQIWQDAATRAALGISDAFQTHLFNNFDEGLGGMLKSFKDIVKRMLIEAAFAKLGQVLLGVAGNRSSGGKGGFFTQFLSSVGQGLVDGRAAGGPVTKNRPYIVGEVGPELFVPSRSGTIVPNHAMGGGGGSVTVNYSVDARGADPASAANMISALERTKAETIAAVSDMIQRRQIPIPGVA